MALPEIFKTQVITVDAAHPDAGAIEEAASIIRRGRLVAFPTETVYGLGANARDSMAVSTIFVAKQRPSSNPLIVHTSSTEEAQALAARWPPEAEALAAAFWPGPLSIVVPRSKKIPDIVSAGKPTVALRVPSNPVALALLRAARVPVAAPSANRSEKISPTTAEHVLHTLDGRIPAVLDGGPALGGIESTVIAITSDGPMILRPGLISPAEIEAVIGPVRRSDGTHSEEVSDLATPGIRLRHYAPQSPLILVNAANVQKRLAKLFSKLSTEANRGYITLSEETKVGYIGYRTLPDFEEGLLVQMLPDSPQGYAEQLYAALHTMDAAKVHRIVAEIPPDDDDWLAIRDRLGRASLYGFKDTHS